MTPRHFAFDAMGTKWKLTVWDEMEASAFAELGTLIQKAADTFEQLYSRFLPDSLISQLSQKTGRIEVPSDLGEMLRMYERVFQLSDGKLNPLVGHRLSDLGYDREYSLTPQSEIREAPDFAETIRIIDDTHIELHAEVLIDLGALGKGFFVDKSAALLREKGLQRFLMDGSGDIYYQGNGSSIRAGLEHPDDSSKVIGQLELTQGALCSSGSNRRKWKNFHHIIDPQASESPDYILASWVQIEKAAWADILATGLFLMEPEVLSQLCDFEYCLLNRELRVKRSAGFAAELFSP